MWSIIGSAHPEERPRDGPRLLVQGRLDVDTNPTAQQVHRLMKGGNLTGWSFGYKVKGRRRGKQGETIITKVALHEVGPCLVGANEEAQLVGVKSIGESEADTPDLEDMSNEELRAYSEAVIAGIDTKGHLPIRIASFRC